MALALPTIPRDSTSMSWLSGMLRVWQIAAHLWSLTERYSCASMKRAILLYSSAIAATALALQWLEYRYVVRVLPTEAYVLVIAVGFTALGVWVGYRLTSDPRPQGFERNGRAIATLGISSREIEVLDLLAEGCSNKEIADRLCISPHTVKTHLGHLYDKLDVRRRTQAVQKARELKILP